MTQDRQHPILRDNKIFDYLLRLRSSENQDILVSEFRLLYGDPLAAKPKGTIDHPKLKKKENRGRL